MPALLMNIREVSDLTGIPVETLRRWRKRRQGEGPPSITVEGSVRYKRADVMSWYESLAPEPLATGTDG
jgi:DNA-binding transcriptional MerR regulator